jgi:hypothetical protein
MKQADENKKKIYTFTPLHLLNCDSENIPVIIFYGDIVANFLP